MLTPESAPVPPESPAPPVEATETAASAIESPAPAAHAEGDGSLAQHEEAVERAREDNGQFAKSKYRSSKQRASADDVPRISELTKNWRTTEERALKAEKELAELREQLKPKPAAPRLREVPQVETKAFEEPEPKLEDFADQSDPYAAWMRAVNAYDRKRERFDEQQTSLKKQAEEAQSHNQEQMAGFFRQKSEEFGTRLNRLISTQTDAKELLLGIAELPTSRVMHAAFLLHPQGEQWMLQVARNKAAFESRFEDLAFDTAEKAVTPHNVEAIQRRLTRWLQDAQSTGSSAPAQKVTIAPRPPNPVRTAAMRSADMPPADDSSLAEHEGYYGRK